MYRERTGNHPGTVLAKQILGSGENLGALTTGRQDNPILQQVISQLENDPIGQACFFKTLFQNIANEGGPQTADRRNAAMAILTHKTDDNVRLSEGINSLLKTNPTAIFRQYLNVVRGKIRRIKITNEDFFSDAVGGLVDVGEAIVSSVCMPQQDKMKREIIDMWERVAEDFPAVDKQFHIHSRFEGVKSRISPDTKELFIKTTAQRYEDLIELRKQGLPNAEIRERLGISRSRLSSLLRYLIANGEIKKARRGRRRKPQESSS